MGNSQAAGSQVLEETPSSYTMEVQAQSVRPASRLSLESVAQEISLDGAYMQTGVPTPTSTQQRRVSNFLGSKGDEAVANSPRKQPPKQPRRGHSRDQSVPQTVLKFEQQMEKTGNQFEKYREQLKALLERESPSNRDLKLTSSGGVRLPAPIGRHELARMQLVHGANYFPVHAPKYYDTINNNEKNNLQVLKIDKKGLVLYSGSHWEGFDYGGGMTKMDTSRLNKKLGVELIRWNLTTVAQWRVFEHHFSFRYIDPEKQDGSQKTYTIETAEPASIGKTIEAYVGALMEDLGMDIGGTFTPQVENFASAAIHYGNKRGINEEIKRKQSISSSPRSFGRNSINDDGSGSPNSQARRRSSFLVDSPLQKASSKKSLVDATSSSSVNTGKSGPARRRQSLSKMTQSEDFGITLISGLVGRRAGGFMGLGKTFKKKFYVVYKTSQGHYLAEYRDSKTACLPQNPRPKWKWPKAWIDLSTTLRGKFSKKYGKSHHVTLQKELNKNIFIHIKAGHTV